MKYIIISRILRLLQQYYDAYGIEKKSRSIPAIFMKGNYMVGSKAITSLLEERIKDNSDPNCPSLSPEQQAVGILGEGETPNILSTLSFSLLTGDALSNMFAPGMVALVLLFLAILSATKSKEEIIKASAYYIAGIFLVYLLFGLGMFSSFYDSQLHYLFYKSVGIAAMLFGLGRGAIIFYRLGIGAAARFTESSEISPGLRTFTRRSFIYGSSRRHVHSRRRGQLFLSAERPVCRRFHAQHRFSADAVL